MAEGAKGPGKGKDRVASNEEGLNAAAVRCSKLQQWLNVIKIHIMVDNLWIINRGKNWNSEQSKNKLLIINR